MTETRSWRGVRKRPWAKECEQPPETEEVKGCILLCSLQKEHSLANILVFQAKILAFSKYWEYSQPRGLPDPGNQPESPVSPALHADSLSPEPVSESHSIMSDSWRPHGLYSPWNFPGQNTGVGSLSLLQGIFSTPGIELRFPALQADSLPAEPQGKPKNTEVGSLSLLQGIFLTQESNRGLLHCTQILYQLSYGFPDTTYKNKVKMN